MDLEQTGLAKDIPAHTVGVGTKFKVPSNPRYSVIFFHSMNFH